MLVMLREQLRFQPDIVMLGYLPADLSRNLLAFRDFAKPWYTLEADTGCSCTAFRCRAPRKSCTSTGPVRACWI